MNDTEQVPHEPAKQDSDFGTAIAIGLPIGTALGVVFGNVGMGVALGMGVATLWHAIGSKRQGRQGANLTLALAIGALALVILMWVLTS